MYNIYLYEEDNDKTSSLLINLSSDEFNIFTCDTLNKNDIKQATISTDEDRCDCIFINIAYFNVNEIKNIYNFVRSIKTRVPFICFSNDCSVDDDYESEYLDVCDDFITNPFERISVMKRRLTLQINNIKYIQKIESISYHDQLTELYNRRYLKTIEKNYIEICKTKQANLFLLMIDVDNFKHFNDKFGHDVGDEVLKYISNCMRNTFRREVDNCIRFGGDEFLIISIIDNKDVAKDMANKLKKLIADNQKKAKDRTDRITCSIGVYCGIPDDDISIEDIKKLSDNALYKAKKNGKDKIVFI